MTNAINITRTMQVENETGLSGSEAQTVDAFDDLDLEIAAAAVWPGQDAGLAAIKAMQLQSMALLTDQDCEALFLGPAYNLEETTDEDGAGANAFIEFVGDLSEILFPGDILLLEGTAADDGVYMVANEPLAYPALNPVVPTVDFPGVVVANTDIFLANGHTIAAVGPVAPGTFRKIMSVQHFNPRYDIADVGGICNVGPPGNIVWPGDLTEQFEAGDYFVITHGTNPAGAAGKDGIYQIATIVFAAGVTTITIPLAQAFEEGTNDGLFHRVRLTFPLAANVPLLWSVEGGTNNPLQGFNTWTALQGDVAQLRIINPGATAAALEGRLPRDVVLP